MIKTVIMGTGRMGSLIRTTAEGIVDAAGQPVFDIVAQIGFDLSELENAPAADVIIDFSNVATFDAVVAYVERTGAALVSGTTGYTPEQMDRLRRNLRQARERELTPRQRQMVALYYDRGLNMVQIARRLGVNRSTVSRTLRRARDRLYRYLRYGL